MSNDNGTSLVIVESPAKARTLAGILGRQYIVKASVGHIRDLPKSRLGVDIDHGFEPHYVVPREKRRVVQELREAAAKASMVYLATDPDREGEAIAWHLVQAADLEGRPCLRTVFHEITPRAIRDAFRSPREIDMQLVNAQQARRILDRLVGYKLSPLLWQKVRGGLSAGRVQSVALRLVVERQREIESFLPKEYWTIEAELTPVGDRQGRSFRAKLVGLAKARKKLEIASQEVAQSLVALLADAAYSVASLQRKEQARRPAAPFTTSTLQQEAARRFRFSPKRTMALAQQLYEGLSLGGEGTVGLITYMRTDSTHVAEVAVRETRTYIRDRFGQEYIPASPQVYKKKAKLAQEAHEAIRPTSVRREPESIRRFLNPEQFRLYTLIWQRMVASQMANAVYDVTTVDVEAKIQAAEAYVFRAVQTQLRFAGYRQLYVEASDEADEQQDISPLPDLSADDVLRLLGLTPEQHFTEPSPRYSEATLVKALEEKGIGRPSTYAPILATIQERGYVERADGRLRPTELGYVVNDLLTTYFAEVVDVSFTARMEDELDDIARGERPWQPVVREFYEPLIQALAVAQAAPAAVEPTEEVCEQCGQTMVVRWGRHGRFLACSGYPQCRNSRPVAAEHEPEAQKVDEVCPKCGAPMVAKSGRYGPFLSCSRYPECQGSRPLLDKVDVACPQCGGEMVARRGRRGRTFYGCANYPACNFSVWSRPLRQPCPQCAGLLLSDGRERARCYSNSCGWRGEAAAEELAGTPG